MATTRQRRASMYPPVQTPDPEEDRVYTEEDYAIPADKADLPDTWGGQPIDPAAWADDAFLPDDAFQPDEEDADGTWDEPLPPEEDESGYSGLFSGVFDDDMDDDPLAEDLLTDEELAELRRSNWQLLSGLADFAGIILGTAAILLLVTMLVSLVNWLVNDMNQSFILLQKHF